MSEYVNFTCVCGRKMWRKKKVRIPILRPVTTALALPSMYNFMFCGPCQVSHREKFVKDLGEVLPTEHRVYVNGIMVRMNQTQREAVENGKK